MTQDNTGIDSLLNTAFQGKVVRKDLTKLLKEGANVPVYVLEYLLRDVLRLGRRGDHPGRYPERERILSQNLRSSR